MPPVEPVEKHRLNQHLRCLPVDVLQPKPHVASWAQTQAHHLLFQNRIEQQAVQPVPEDVVAQIVPRMETLHCRSRGKAYRLPGRFH